MNKCNFLPESDFLLRLKSRILGWRVITLLSIHIVETFWSEESTNTFIKNLFKLIIACGNQIRSSRWWRVLPGRRACLGLSKKCGDGDDLIHSYWLSLFGHCGLSFVSEWVLGVIEYFMAPWTQQTLVSFLWVCSGSHRFFRYI